MTAAKPTPTAFQLPPDLDILLALAGQQQEKNRATVLTRWIKLRAEQDAVALLAAGEVNGDFLRAALSLSAGELELLIEEFNMEQELFGAAA